MMIPIYPPKVFKIISSISQNLYGIKPWINSTPKVIINTAKRVLVLFFSNLMYIKNPKGINKTILPITLYINCPNGYSKSIFKIILNGIILNILNPSNLYPSLIGNNVNDIINNIDKNKKKFKISDL